MADYQTEEFQGDQQGYEEQYDQQDPYEDPKSTDYQEETTDGYQAQTEESGYQGSQEGYQGNQGGYQGNKGGYQGNQGGYQSNNRGRGRGRGDSRGGYRGNSRGRGSFGRGGSRGGSAARGGGFVGQKRSFQRDEYQGSMTGSIEFVKKRKINDNVYRILVPVRSVKSIIGPGGQNIKQLKEDAGEGCKISIYTQGTNKVPLPEGTTERVVSIEGSPEQLSKCLNEVVKNIQAAPFDRFRGKFILKLMVPEHTCSIVIGPKGANTKKIREETETIVQLFRDPLPASGEHVVNLKNQDPQKLVEAAVKVFESIQDAKSKNNVLLYEPHMWTPGEFGTTGSFHDEEYEVYTRFNTGQQHQGSQQQFYNNQGYDDDQTYYNDEYDDQSYYNDQTGGQGYAQGGYEEEYVEEGYQEQQPPPASRGGSRGRARGPLLGSAPSTRGGQSQRGGPPSSRGASRGGSYGGRGGQRGSYGSSRGSRGNARGGSQQSGFGGSRGGSRGGGYGAPSRGRGAPRGASRGSSGASRGSSSTPRGSSRGAPGSRGRGGN